MEDRSDEREAKGKLQPSSTGSLGEQGPASSSQSLVRISDEVKESTHVGALLTEQAHSERLLNRAVALAALRDADASRRFLENQVDELQRSRTQLRDELQTAMTNVAVLKTRLSTVLSARLPQQLVFGIGAAILGAGLSTGLADNFTLLKIAGILIGTILMVIGALNPVGRTKR